MISVENRTFDKLSRISLKSLYRERIVQSISISSDFKTITLVAKNFKAAKITVAKKTAEILAGKGELSI